MLRFKRHAARQESRDGFTLIELLVAMTVLGLLMTLLFANIQTGTKTWVHSESHFFEANKIHYAQILLRKQISQIYPKFLRAGDSVARVDFEGHGNAVLFLAPAPQGASSGSLVYTKVELAPNNGDLQLVMRMHPELAWNDAADQDTLVLIKGVKSAQFSYFGKDVSGSLSSWHDEWLGRQELPQLVRVNVQFKDEKKSFWPELTVAPRISVDVACVYDLLTKYCQGR